jgi:hypothetical protein
LPLTIALAKLSSLSMKDHTGHCMASFPAIELRQYFASIILVINIAEEVETFGYTSRPTSPIARASAEG